MNNDKDTNPTSPAPVAAITYERAILGTGTTASAAGTAVKMPAPAHWIDPGNGVRFEAFSITQMQAYGAALAEEARREADLKARNDVAQALGLLMGDTANGIYSFAWSYLLTCIGECVKACDAMEESAPVAEAAAQADDETAYATSGYRYCMSLDTFKAFRAECAKAMPEINATPTAQPTQTLNFGGVIYEGDPNGYVQAQPTLPDAEKMAKFILDTQWSHSGTEPCCRGCGVSQERLINQYSEHAKDCPVALAAKQAQTNPTKES